MPGTTDGSSPFWSPDSRSIAFLSDGKVRRVDVSGGPVIALADASAAPPGAWSRNDVILYSSTPGPLSRVSASGGTPVQVTDLIERGDRIHIAPFFLPDGRHFVYTAGTGGSLARSVFVASLDSKQPTRLVESASNAQYANGYLLFLRETTLMAQRFDPDTLTPTGESIPIALDVQINPAT